MNEHILIVEDEQELCMTLGDRLTSEGYAVEFAFDGKSGLDKIKRLPFDLFILDIMLPFKSGLDLCTDIRQSGLTTPILLLTALSQTVEKVAGLKLGADDYVTKPFHTLELMARVEALLRRAPSRADTLRPSTPDHYQFGSIAIDLRRNRVSQNGNPIALTSREFQLLRYLVEHRGVAVSREQLLEQVWGQIPGTLTRTVDMHVASLRQKLEPFPKRPEMILTVQGLGYKFQIPDA
jgi:two-component system alkaline phosphatase synthesis response regulator PhoP